MKHNRSEKVFWLISSAVIALLFICLSVHLVTRAAA